MATDYGNVPPRRSYRDQPLQPLSTLPDLCSRTRKEM
jgi:hypothetical protein